MRRDRSIGQTFDLVQTDVTRFAGRLQIFLAEVFRQFAVATVDAAAQPAHMIEQLARCGDDFSGRLGIAGAFFDQRFPAQHVGGE